MRESVASIKLSPCSKSAVSAGRGASLLDEALVGIANGEVEAFHALYAATKAKVAKTCFLVCENRAVADELTADVYAIVWQKASHWDRSRGSVITWMCAIARNRAVDWQRKQRYDTWANLNEIADLPDDGPCSAATLQRYQEIALAVAELAKLPNDQRLAITAAFFQERTYSSLAAELDIPLGTLKARIRRGLAALRERLSVE